MAVSKIINKLLARSNKSKHSLSANNRISLQLETLETREVLSATIFQKGDVLHINGTGGDDSIQIEQISAGDWRITSTNGKTGPTVQDWNLGSSGSSTPVNRVHIKGYGGNDLLVAKQVNVAVIMNGGAGNDSLQGGAGNDTLRGGGGADEFTGGSGNDSFVGGAGYDTIVEETTTNVTIRADQMTGGTGTDTFSEFEHIMVTATDTAANRYARLTLDASQAPVAVTLQGKAYYINTLIGSRHDDTLLGGNDALNYLRGLDGNDSLYGGRFGDNLRGGNGNDLLDGADGHDWMYGDAGADELIAGGGAYVWNDWVYGGSGFDTITATSNGDVRITAEEIEFLGKDGANPYHFQYTTGNMRFHEVEHITVSATLPGMDPYLLEMFEEHGGLDRLPGIAVDATHAPFGVTIRGGINTDQLYGSQYDDLIEGGGGADILHGNAGNDSLYGGAGDDYLRGGSGNDGLYGGSGLDLLYGDSGADRFLMIEGDRDHTDGKFGRYGEDALITFRNLPESKHKIDGYATGFRFAAGSWTDEEIQKIDVALANLHHHTGNTRLLKQFDGKELVFARAGAQLTSLTETIASWNVDGVITFTDAAFQSDMELFSRVYHEIGHNWDEPAENHLSEFFRDQSQWVESSTDLSGHGYVASTAYGDNWWYNPNMAPFAEADARFSPQEDYATTWEAYFMNEYHGTTNGKNLVTAKLKNLDRLFADLR